MQSTLASPGPVSPQAQTRLPVQTMVLELKEQLTAAKTQVLILLLHNVEGLSYSMEDWRVKASQQRANRFLVNIQLSSSALQL